MSLKYLKIKKHPTTFLRLFGVKVEQFQTIMEKVRPLWEAEVIDQYKRAGRNFKLPREDIVSLTLLYYRTYSTQIFIGYLYDIHNSQISRLIRRLEALLAQMMTLSKEKILGREEIESLIIDATEQAMEPAQKDQKPYYSGKKKRHTVKTEIRVSLEGEIVHVSKMRPGSVHDFALHKEEAALPPELRVYVDSGYHGLDKLHEATELPYKASKSGPVEADEKEYNRALSHVLVKVENVLAQLKVFRILSERYRNKMKRYEIKCQIIAGIVNLKNGFMTS